MMVEKAFITTGNDTTYGNGLWHLSRSLAFIKYTLSGLYLPSNLERGFIRSPISQMRTLKL